jgi:hypothetical protein
MGYEEGELELEEGEAALGSADGYCNGGGGGGELVDPDALTYIVRDGSLPLFFFSPSSWLTCGLDGWLLSWCCAVSCWVFFFFLRRADCWFDCRSVAAFFFVLR